MSAGTDASILGYGNKPLENSSMANNFNSHFAGTFGSNEIPTAKPYPGIGSLMSGGKRRRGGSCGCNKLFGGNALSRSRARSMSRSRSIAGGKRRKSSRKTSRKNIKRLILGRSGGSRRRRKRGGVYQQFMSNIASTPGYAIGAPLSASTSALANPPPIQVYNHSTTPFSEADRPTHA